MSRSRKKNPIIGHTLAESEKRDKQRASRATRRVNAFRLKACQDLGEFEPLSNAQINGAGAYVFAKDGKQTISPENPNLKKFMRK
jgi:hypothetical protein